jgi:hypothetical protein
MEKPELTISATAFKARCLRLLDDLASGKTSRIRVTKRGKVIVDVLPSVEDAELFGSMRGLVLRGGGEDLLEPLEIDEPSDPFLGMEHSDRGAA